MLFAMLETRWPAAKVIAAVLWALALLLTTIDALTPGCGLHAFGIIACAAGGVLNIRCWFQELKHREENAFEIGRDAGMHSVK
jgi:hypothetical protein